MKNTAFLFVSLALSTLASASPNGGPLGDFAPGNSFTRSNGTFNPDGTSAAHYAGNVPDSHPFLNGAAAQYDVACFQQFSKTVP